MSPPGAALVIQVSVLPSTIVWSKSNARRSGLLFSALVLLTVMFFIAGQHTPGLAQAARKAGVMLNTLVLQVCRGAMHGGV